MVDESAYWLFSTIPQVFAAILAVLFILFSIRDNKIHTLAKSIGQKLLNDLSAKTDRTRVQSEFEKLANFTLMLDTKKYSMLANALDGFAKEYEQINDFGIKKRCQDVAKTLRPISISQGRVVKGFSFLSITIIVLIATSLIISGQIHFIPCQWINKLIHTYLILTTGVFGFIIYYTFVAFRDTTDDS